MPREFVDSLAEMEELLRSETIGFLGLCLDGKPYVVPINYAYRDGPSPAEAGATAREGGKILFHCALEGKKLDAIRANPNACLTVGRQTGSLRRHGDGELCHVDSDSVMCFGRARIVVDNPERAALLNAFNRAFRPNAPDIPENQVRHCAVIEITVDEMTGRRERARERTLWRHVFRA